MQKTTKQGVEVIDCDLKKNWRTDGRTDQEKTLKIDEDTSMKTLEIETFIFELETWNFIHQDGRTDLMGEDT